MNFDKEKIRISMNAVHNAYLQCEKAYRTDCPISVAGNTLKTVG